MGQSVACSNVVHMHVYPSLSFSSVPFRLSPSATNMQGHRLSLRRQVTAAIAAVLLILLIAAPPVGAAFEEGANARKRKTETFRVCLLPSPNLPAEPVNAATHMLYDCKDQVRDVPRRRAGLSLASRAKPVHSRHLLW